MTNALERYSFRGNRSHLPKLVANLTCREARGSSHFSKEVGMTTATHPRRRHTENARAAVAETTAPPDISNLQACIDDARAAGLNSDPGPQDPVEFSPLRQRLALKVVHRSSTACFRMTGPPAGSASAPQRCGVGRTAGSAARVGQPALWQPEMGNVTRRPARRCDDALAGNWRWLEG